MPRGEYALIDPAGTQVGIESFTTAPGPMGWRYFATITPNDDAPDGRVDVSVDATGRVVRARFQRGPDELIVIGRGGVLQAQRNGDVLDLDTTATSVAYPSPGVFAAQLHALTGTETMEVLAVDPDGLTVSRAPRTFEDLGPTTAATPVGGFDARAWRIGEQEIAINGALVLSVSGAFDLRDYEAGATGPHPRLRPL